MKKKNHPQITQITQIREKGFPNPSFTSPLQGEENNEFNLRESVKSVDKSFRDLL